MEVADPARTGVEHAVFTACICLRIRCVSVFAFRVHVLPRLLLGFSVLLTTTCLVSDLHRFAAARPNLGGGKWRWRTENVETQEIRLEAVYTVPLRGGLFVCFLLSARLL